MTTGSDIDVAVIGGGVTGLATARALARRGVSVALLERQPRFGMEASTHNSGVIHAGLYFPPTFLKTTLAIEGRAQLYAFCDQHGVPHQRCGKLLVASSPDDLPALRALAARAHENGVTDLVELSPADAAAREPHVHAAGALLSPSSGILSAEALVGALVRECARLDVALLPATTLDAIEHESDGSLTVVTPRERIRARMVVNAAGAWADRVSAAAGGETFHVRPCRGEYASLAPRARHLVRGLVYPLPHTHSLGVHLTPTVHGEVLVGPTADFQESRDDCENGRRPVEAFLAPAQQLLPALRLEDLRPAGAGVRAKIYGPGEPVADFMIRRDTRVPALIHAAGIESPGLTACLAVGDRVAEIASGA